MATQWYWERNGKGYGPLTSSQLRLIAEQNQLLRTDLVWRNDAPNKVVASEVTGLFAEPSASTPPNESPPSQDPAVSKVLPKELANSHHLISTMKSLWTTTKSAGQIAAKQAEKVKLTTVALPLAYRSLGEYWFSSQKASEEFRDLYQQLDQLNQRIDSLGKNDNTLPSPKSFSDKTKFIGGKAMRIAQSTKLLMQKIPLYKQLGEAVYETHRSSFDIEKLVTPITKALARRAELDVEIAALSSQGKGTWITPYRLMISLAVLFAVFVVGMRAVTGKFTEVSRRLATVDQLWDDGDKSGAVSAYRLFDLEGNWLFVSPSKEEVIFNRAVDFYIDEEQDNEAKTWIKKALSHHVTLTPSSEKKTMLLAIAKREVEQSEQFQRSLSQSTSEQAAKEQAAKDKAAKEQAAKEQAAKDKAAKPVVKGGKLPPIPQVRKLFVGMTRSEMHEVIGVGEITYGADKSTGEKLKNVYTESYGFDSNMDLHGYLVVDMVNDRIVKIHDNIKPPPPGREWK